jgi:hypothetical protein
MPTAVNIKPSSLKPISYTPSLITLNVGKYLIHKNFIT